MQEMFCCISYESRGPTSI